MGLLPRTSRRMILFSTIYLATVLIMTMISSASASSNATPTMVSCEDIVASYQVMATVRRAFGCDLGFTNSGVPSACDEQILTSLKSCKPGNMSCLVSGITSTCNGHQDTCGATARVFLGLQQNLAVWCGSDSEPNGTVHGIKNSDALLRLELLSLPVLSVWNNLNSVRSVLKASWKDQTVLIVCVLSVAV